MIRSLFGSDTKIGMLRGGLTEQMATQRGIAARVRQAGEASTQAPFAQELARAGQPPKPEVDLQAEMASLADTQLRYEASTKLLNGAYQSLRTAIRDRG